MAIEIALTPPNEIFAGHDLRIDVGVTVERETRTRGVEVRIQGREGWALGRSSNRRRSPFSHQKVWPNVSRRVAGPGVLPRGTSIFPVELALPADLAPTHQIEPAYSTLEVV